MRREREKIRSEAQFRTGLHDALDPPYHLTSLVRCEKRGPPANLDRTTVTYHSTLPKYLSI